MVRLDGSLAERTTFGPSFVEPRASGTEISGFVQDRWRVNDRLNFELGFRIDRDGVIDRLNYSPRVGLSISALPGGPRHPARGHREVRGADAAHGQCLHAVRRAHGTTIRGGRDATGATSDLRPHHARPPPDAREHRADGGLGPAGRPTFLLQGRVPPPQRRSRLRPRSRSEPRPADAELLAGRRATGKWRPPAAGSPASTATSASPTSDPQHAGSQRLRPVLRQLPQSPHPAQRELAQPDRRAAPGDRARFDRPVRPVGVHADLRVAVRLPVVGRGRVSGFRRHPQPGRPAAVGLDPGFHRSRGRFASRSTASPPASRCTTPSIPAASATCRPTSRRRTTASSTTPSSAPSGS